MHEISTFKGVDIVFINIPGCKWYNLDGLQLVFEMYINELSTNVEYYSGFVDNLSIFLSSSVVCLLKIVTRKVSFVICS